MTKFGFSHVLAQFSITTSKAERDFNHRKVSVQVAKGLSLLKMIGICIEYQSTTKSQILTFVLECSRKSAVKHCIEKHTLHNVVNLCTVFSKVVLEILLKRTSLST